MFEQENFYKDLIDNLFDGVYFVDRHRVITFWNKGAERITGYSANQVIGHSCRDNLLNHVTANGVVLCAKQCPLAACMDDGLVRQADVFLHHADGFRLPVFIRAAPIHDSQGNIIGAVETFSSDNALASLRHELRELRYSVQTDPLTQVRNRQYLERHLHTLVANHTLHAGEIGIVFIDVDHFKQINDSHGHGVGDQVLRMVAATLKHNVRKTDVLGRWGGEEFVAIISDIASLDELHLIAEKLKTLIEYSRLDLEAVSVTTTVSVGATLLRPNDTVESAVQRADLLMYHSKKNGRNRVSIS
jgi:diguanylate cyclase (GGDEF)-like protein/PAS domain S-box-containing protein